MITQTLDLNLIPGRVLPMVNVSQYDKDSRTLEFTIYNGDQSFDLTGLSAYIQGLKPDGHGFNYSANISAGKITADITEQMTAVSGRVMCEIVIMSGADRIGTGNFILNVEAAAMPDGSNMSDSEYSYVEQLIEDAQQAVEDAQAEVENAEAWANGTRDGQTIPATDPAYQKNSKYWSEQASDYSEDAESWANGTRDGQTITSTDPAYQKNSKYWSEQSASYVEDAEAWAVGTRNGTPVPSGSPEYENNAAYWANEARNVAQQTTYTEMGDSLALAPTSAGNALPLTIYGQSTQDGTPTPSDPVAIESASADFRCVGESLLYTGTWHTETRANPFRGITYTRSGNTLKASGKSSGNAYFTIQFYGAAYPKLKIGETYHLQGCPAGGGNNKYSLNVSLQVSGVDTLIASDYGNGVDFIANGDDIGDGYCNLSVWATVANGTTVSNLIFRPQISKASTHCSITTSITLRAIEVSSTDDYNLVKDGKYYIADTIDWDEVDGYQITRRVGTKTLDGSEEWATSGTGTTGKYRMNYNDATIPTYIELGYSDAFHKGCVVSNQFPEATQSSEQPYFCNQTIATVLQTHVWQMYSADYQDVASWKAHLANEPLVVNYRLVTPTKTSITSAQAKALLSMRTYDESTSIDAVNSPAPVLELEYAKTRTPALALTGHNMAHINAIDIGDM